MWTGATSPPVPLVQENSKIVYATGRVDDDDAIAGFELCTF